MKSWNLSRSQYDEINDLPLMATPGPVLMILATYLLFVLKVGPVYMKKREPYKLTTIMLIYNVIQVIFSAVMVQRYFKDLLFMGLFPKQCYLNDDSIRSKVLFSIWLYFSAKVTELLDTIFFVLRKKDNQVTFLHLYHHSVMMVGTWAMLKYWPSHSLIFIGFLNSLVHVLMYTYYGLASLGPNVAKYLTWKKYMTSFQLIQFVSIIIQYVVSVNVSDCPPTKGVAIFIASNTAFFLVLFLNFYKESYVKKKNKIPEANGLNVNGKICDEKMSNGCHFERKDGEENIVNDKISDNYCHGVVSNEILSNRKTLNGLNCKKKIN